jgi:hypothetical protein
MAETYGTPVGGGMRVSRLVGADILSSETASN